MGISGWRTRYSRARWKPGGRPAAERRFWVSPLSGHPRGFPGQALERLQVLELPLRLGDLAVDRDQAFVRGGIVRFQLYRFFKLPSGAGIILEPQVELAQRAVRFGIVTMRLHSAREEIAFHLLLAQALVVFLGATSFSLV